MNVAPLVVFSAAAFAAPFALQLATPVANAATIGTLAAAATAATYYATAGDGNESGYSAFAAASAASAAGAWVGSGVNPIVMFGATLGVMYVGQLVLVLLGGF